MSFELTVTEIKLQINFKVPIMSKFFFRSSNSTFHLKKLIMHTVLFSTGQRY